MRNRAFGISYVCLMIWLDVQSGKQYHGKGGCWPEKAVFLKQMSPAAPRNPFLDSAPWCPAFGVVMGETSPSLHCKNAARALLGETMSDPM